MSSLYISGQTSKRAFIARYDLQYKNHSLCDAIVANDT